MSICCSHSRRRATTPAVIDAQAQFAHAAEVFCHCQPQIDSGDPVGRVAEEWFGACRDHVERLTALYAWAAAQYAACAMELASRVADGQAAPRRHRCWCCPHPRALGPRSPGRRPHRPRDRQPDQGGPDLRAHHPGPATVSANGPADSRDVRRRGAIAGPTHPGRGICPSSRWTLTYADHICGTKPCPHDAHTHGPV